MRNFFAAFIAASTLWACGGDGAGPNTPNLTGTFSGDYTVSLDPGTIYQAALHLTQNGSAVSGTLTTNAGRSANVTGSVSGTRLTGSVTFTDGCGGAASTTADITNNGTRLIGNYTANDCLGQYTGTYTLIRQ